MLKINFTQHLRGGPPLPGNPGGPGGKPWKPGGAGPPTPAAGPVNPIGSPRPAGLLIPGPACNVAALGAPAGPVPNLADGSAGGGPSTARDTTCVPRTIINPRVRFSSISTSGAGALPGAAALFAFDLTRRNSSVSARTRFMCYTTIRRSSTDLCK